MMGERLKLFVPGRTELIGNHTDHQRGRAVAAAVKMGLYAEAEPSAAPRLRVFSEGFAPVEIDLADLAPRETERGTSAALVRGTAASLARRGLPLRTFTARVRSTLPAGAGLSSSAAFSVLIARLLCPDAPAETLAKCAQEAENGYFGKPCGLLDQMTVALGGAVYFDFLTGEVQPLHADFSAMGLALCLTDTGGSHADLTDAYAAIPADMRAVARELGGDVLGCVPEPETLPAGRKYDRARHFFAENRRVPCLRDALERGDAAACIALMNDSGRSSETLLRNITPDGNENALSRGLALSASLLRGVGAWRVHGGGFAGCVQALLPEEHLAGYTRAMDAAFGAGRCRRVL